MTITVPSKWEYDCYYRGGGSLHENGTHFDIDNGDTTVCEFCLIPENEDEARHLDGEKFMYINKDQFYWIFIPIPDTLPAMQVCLNFN